MRIASWEISVGALAAFLNSTTQAHMADLFTITLSGGTVVRYTSADVAVTVNGVTYAVGPVITRGKIRLAVGIEVDTLEMTLAADPSVTINGVPLMQMIAGGGFDGARVSLERAFTSAPGSAWIGTLSLFQGRVSDTHASRYEAGFIINSDSELLNVMVPRNVYQPGCGNTLFDGACNLSKAANAASVTAIGPTDSKKTTFFSNSALATNWFSLGFAVGVTGPNAGICRTIKAFVSGAITTIQPWPFPVETGDTFTAYPGCDKTKATCQGKFNNLSSFRGHPFVPAPESIT